MQKKAMQAILLAVEGIELIAAQQAIKAAMAGVSGVVNKALGWTLL